MLIGLLGYKQSGKSTIATFLVEELGFKELFWAYTLKEIIGRELFMLDDDVLYGDSPKREEILPLWGKSPRQILQIVGTDLFRNNFDKDFWVKTTVPYIEDFLEAGEAVVVSDCRFPNEVDTIKKMGGYTCRIVRSDQKTKDLHESETALDNYEADFRLVAASGQLDSLKNQADEMVLAITRGEV